VKLAPAGGQPPAASNVVPPSGLPPTTTALDIPPIPEEPPPPLPSNLPPPVLNGVLVPPKENDPPPLLADARKAGPVKDAMDGTFRASNVPPARGEIAQFPTTAAKLLADLTASDRTYLTASKEDDGTGHRVVTKKGKVLFLKAGSTQEEETGLRSLVNNRLLGRRDAQTKKALAALLEDAELRGLTLADRGHAATMIKHALELGKHGVTFDDLTRKHVATILTKDVERHRDVAERQNRISTLYTQSKEPQSKNFEAAIDEFVAANGSDFEKGKESTFFKKLGDRVGVTKPPEYTVDESSLSSVDLLNYKFIKSADRLAGVAEDIKKMTTRPEHLKKEDDFYILPASFAGDTQSFVEKNMPGDVGFTQNILIESTTVLAQGLVSQSNLLMGVVAENDLMRFKGGMAEIKRISEKAFRQLEYSARLFTNEQYLAQVPSESVDLLRRFGEALQEITESVLDPRGAYAKFYRMAQAALTSPETAMPYFRKALGLSDTVQAGESTPPLKPLPPIPTGVLLDQKLGPVPAVQPPLPTAVAGGSPQSNAVETT
jgi:hypothetical protein